MSVAGDRVDRDQLRDQVIGRLSAPLGDHHVDVGAQRVA
jgi:hypothetical protein